MHSTRTLKREISKCRRNTNTAHRRRRHNYTLLPLAITLHRMGPSIRSAQLQHQALRMTRLDRTHGRSRNLSLSRKDRPTGRRRQLRRHSVRPLLRV